nr:MAG TPA: hypothetical protein [Caudoviricetes sp.]
MQKLIPSATPIRYFFAPSSNLSIMSIKLMSTDLSSLLSAMFLPPI